MDEASVLERLLRQYSPSGHEESAVAEFRRLARALGYRARTDRVGNGIAETGRGRPLVLFLGHIDTVEGDRPVRRARGKIYGRGAVDAKGALAAALVAGQGFSGPGTFRVVAAVGEETDSRGARHLARGPAPDALIAGEPSGWNGVTIGYKGDLRLEATFSGPRRHWSSPFPTATDLALSWTAGVREIAQAHSAESPFRSLSAKAVGCSSDPSADPESATVTMDLRLPPGLSTGEVLAKLPTSPRRPRVRVLVRIEPAEIPRSDPVAVALCAAIRDAGGQPTLWRRTGTSDLNLVSRAWGIGGAAYGPGDSRLDHTDRELLSAAELRRAAGVLRGALDRLTRPPAGATTPLPVAGVP